MKLNVENIKKLLIAVLIASEMAVFGQYQLPNPGFENWEGNQDSRPLNWNGFPTADCSITTPIIGPISCSAGRGRRHQRSTDIRPGSIGQYSLRLFSTNPIGNTIANGNMTTGTVNIGSTDAADSKNYNFTKRSDPNKSQPFAGCPDSVLFWAKLNVSNHTTTQARISVSLHGNVDYKDPNDGATGRMAHAAYNFSCPDKDWHQYSYPFTYDNATTPSYILISLTTNAIPGGGSNGDEVYFDDIEMIYNVHLNDLMVDGISIPEFHRDKLDYVYFLCQGDPIPAISHPSMASYSPKATPALEQAYPFNDNTASVEITHSGWYPDSSRVYTVKFVYLDVPTVAPVAVCGTGEVTLSATPKATTARWYDALIGGNLLATSTTFNPSINGDTTFYVSSYNADGDCESDRVPLVVTINPIPEVPVPAPASLTQCGGGFISLSATYGNNGDTCRWYADNASDDVLYESNIYSANVNNSTSFWVSSYNSTTGCESPRIEISITINSIPAVPEMVDIAFCDIANNILLAPANNNLTDITFVWSLENTTLAVASDFTISSLTQTTTYSVFSRDTITTCESAPVDVTINISPSYNTTLPSIDTCDAYTWNGTIYTESQFVSDTFQTISGCDSILSFNLTIRNSTAHTINDIICQGYDYTDYGFNLPVQTVSGIFSKQRIISNVAGCDSIITLNLTVNPTYHNQSDTAIKRNGFPYTYQGVSIPIADDTTFTVTYNTIAGCDSTFTLVLTIMPDTMPVYVCQNNFPYQRGDSSFYTSGLYSVTFQDIDGTDSIVFINIIENDTFKTTDAQEACVSYSWGGQNRTATDVYIHTFTASNGCDSTVALTLTIKQPVQGTPEYVAECVSYQWKGKEYTTSGTYMDTLTGVASNGCDSIEVLHLTIKQPVTNQLNEIACISYTWNDSTYLGTGNYVQVFTAANGCDSTVTLHLTIKQPVVEDIYHSECVSYQWKGKTYLVSGNYRDTLKGGANNGCDSITILHLTINQPVTNQFNDIACDSYSWNDSTYLESGNYVQIFTAANGCDSTVTLHLTINLSSDTTFFEDAICQGEVYAEHGFNLPMQTQVGTRSYYQNLTNVLGCDSVISLSLTVSRRYTQDIPRTECDSYTWNDSTYYESGDYTHTYQTIHGCDSVVTLKLTINPSSQPAYFTDAICQGEVYTENGFDLPAQDSVGVFEHSFNFRTINGCDSISHLTLTVHPTGEFHIQDTVELGKTYTKYGFNITPDVVGVFRDTLSLTSLHNCDSIIMLLLFALEDYSSIHELDVEQTVYLFPNPAQHQVTISASESIEQVIFYDIDGKELNAIYPSDEIQVTCDINHYAKGIYFVKIQTKNGVSTKKLVIQ